MSNFQYGLISETDARCLEKTIDLICNQFKDEPINITEIGIYSGQTGSGILEYVEWEKKTLCILTGIDNHKDGQELTLDPYQNKIIGNSNEVYNQLEDNSQHLIFVDGCHCFAHVVSDFFCYAPKVKVGGYLAFHDTGKHIKEFKDFQHGDEKNPDAYISVRKALNVIGLLNDDMCVVKAAIKQILGMDWELVFDQSDETNEAGGICCLRKIY